jgi:YVTN family beta-propeller protein
MSLDARARRAAQAARTQVDRLPPPPAIGVLVARRRRRAAAASALALIVALVGVGWRALPTGGREPAATGLPGHVQAAIRVGRAPGAVLVAGGSVWVANSGDGTVSRIDPATNRVIATIDVIGHPTQLTADSPWVWVATREGLRRIDPASNLVVQTLPLPVNVGDVLAAGGWLWVALDDGTVWRLDPADGGVLASIPVASRGASVLASGGGRLWAANRDMLVAIDPRRATVTDRFIDNCCQGRLTDLALVDGGAWKVVWKVDSKGAVFRIPVDPPTPSDRPTDPIVGYSVSSLEGPQLIAAGPTGVFLASPAFQTITRVDPVTLQVRATIRLPGLSRVAVGADAVWATADDRGLLYRIDPQATD